MPKKNNTYDESLLQKALSEIKEGKISKKGASKTYGIPRSTLQFRLGSKFLKIRPGPQTILTHSEEETIVDWVKVSQRKGFPKRKEDVLYAVKDFLEVHAREHPFGEDILPGKGWFNSFLKWHPTLTFRATDAVSTASANLAASDIFGWFEKIENNYFRILSDPTRIYN